MHKLSQHELLRMLHAQLHHFEQSPDFGDQDAVAVIRQHLLRRIREAESGMQERVRISYRRGFGSKHKTESEAA